MGGTVSFQLHLHPESGGNLDADAVDAFFRDRPYVSERWRYENPDTGVYFTFDFGEAGLRFEINIARPRFFAHEAMPVVVSLCEALNLLLVDPQDKAIGGDGSPKPAAVEELIGSWETNNRAAIGLYCKYRGPVLTVPHATAEAWWQYQFGRADLQERFGSNVFVPQVLMLRDIEHGTVQTAVTWTDAVPFIFPPCDWLIVDREQAGQTVAACVDAAAARVTLRNLLSRLVADAGTLDVLTPGRRDEAAPIYEQLPVVTTLDRFQALGSDEYVDDPIEGETQG